MKIRYDAEVDALYIEIRPLEPGTAECRELTPDITADYGPDGKLAGLEILDASEVLGEDCAQGSLGTGPRGIGRHGVRRRCVLPSSLIPHPSPMSIFDKLKQGLKKTSQLLRTDIRDIFKVKGRLVNDAFLEQCFEALVKTDMGVGAATAIGDEFREKLFSRVVELDEILDPG